MDHINNIPVQELRPGFLGRLIHGQKATMSMWDIKQGSRMDTHQHVHEQITYLLEGELEMNIGGVDYVLTPGCYHVIPSNVPHSAFARTDVKVMDFFSPARDDYR
ncbi:MAG TPA: cupin domain-containing protein [Lacibacter sp.]|nr:cupin domain-containing protein [Lacibacter sp.]HMO88478.1 cupin domain-containing protein [Lacibacter sp.]HMP87979.1 cupin domain-containing protein [Lacibacter sp.]